ncbi:MAG: DUF6457 domain-containing protein [Actinomycetota bacterium]
MTARTWLEGFAAATGTAAPTDEEFEALLRLAAVAAHASERQAAPVACFMAARAGLDLEQAIALAESVPAE